MLKIFKEFKKCYREIALCCHFVLQPAGCENLQSKFEAIYDFKIYDLKSMKFKLVDFISCCRTIWIAAIFALRKSRTQRVAEQNYGVVREFAVQTRGLLRICYANSRNDSVVRKFTANLGA